MTASDAQEDVVVLADGRRVTIRQVRSDDLEELRRAIRDADGETLRARFLGGRPPQTDAELRRLVEVDHVSREAFVAIAPDGHGVGIARYDILPGVESADVAVAVDAQWRKVGLATALLTRVIAAALRQGVDQVHADYYAANEDVAGLLRRAGRPTQHDLVNGVVDETIVVDPGMVLPT